MIVKNVLPNSMVKTIKQMIRNPKDNDCFAVEGIKLCSELFASNYKTKFIVVEKNATDQRINDLINKFVMKGVRIYETAYNHIQNMSDTVTPQGIIAIVSMPNSAQQINRFETLLPNQSFILFDNISDPGNVGTMMRTAEWFGIKQILMYGNCANPYNSKVIRSSMGSIFRVKITQIKHTDYSFDYINKNFRNLNIYAADINATFGLNDIIDKDDAFGLVIGSESHGISKEIDSLITQKFIIRGKGQAESLNAGVALGVSLFHLSNNKRQR